MARVVLGPMLRYVDSTSAVVWVETDAPCRAEPEHLKQRLVQPRGHIEDVSDDHRQFSHFA